MEAITIGPQKDSVQSTADMTLSAQQLYRHDPLLFLLKGRLHLNNFWISAGAMSLPGIVYLVWWLLWGSHYASGWITNNLLSIMLQTFILFPFLFLIYTLIPTVTAKIFTTFYEDGAIGQYRKDPSDVEAYVRFKKQLVFWMDNGWWAVTIMAVLIFYVLLRFFTREFPDHHTLLQLAIRAVVLIIYAPLIFATGMNVIRLVLALIFVNRLFYLFTFQTKPIPSDGSGGLGSLEGLLWLCVSMMLWVTILLAALILGRNVTGLLFAEMFLLSTIYITLIPTILIGWLIFPHRMMVRARNDALQPLAIEYQHALMLSLSARTQDVQSIAAETLCLETLKKRYDLVYNSISVWPLDISMLSGAGISMLLPIVLPLIFPFIVSFISFVLQRVGL